jgi:hypothetical protein
LFQTFAALERGESAGSFDFNSSDPASPAACRRRPELDGYGRFRRLPIIAGNGA